MRAYEHAKSQVIEHRELLDQIAEGLLERETLNQAELQTLREGGELPPLPQVSPGPAGDPLAAGEETAPPRFGDKTIPEPEPMPS